MSRYSFEGRVAVVTGSGRGIGRAHAMLLARRGASVVVNDLGGAMEGTGADPEPAHAVAREIIDAGGDAIANTSDVTTVDGGEAVIETAIKEFGRIDVLVNNAGIALYGGLPQVDADNIGRHLAIHIMGSFNTTRAAWPYMVEQNYGRIVMTTSSGIFGMADNLGYAIGKAGLIGMAHAMTVNAGDRNIKINLIAPGAATRMAVHPSGGLDDLKTTGPPGKPEWVAPMVAYLAHEDCPVSGEIYQAGSGRFARLFVAANDGFVHLDPDQATIEDVADNWDAINDLTEYYVPTSLLDWAKHWRKRPK